MRPTTEGRPSSRDVHFDRETATIADAIAKAEDRAPVRPTRSLSIVSDDGVALAADLFLPDEPARARLLLAPAMGVKRTFYARFLADLASHGIASLVLDYRGIAGSRLGAIRSVDATLSDWGERDLAAATRALVTLDMNVATPDVPNLFIGHSVGGQLFGLMKDLPFESAYFVASQAGYWGHWQGLSKVGMIALWFGAIPLFTRTLGYLPMKVFGQGEDIPRGVAQQWAEWGRDPSYVGVRAAALEGCGYDAFGGRLRAVSIEDDGYAPERAVRELVRAYASAIGDVTVVRPGALGVDGIGHFGWFHPRFRDSLWSDARRFLLGDEAD